MRERTGTLLEHLVLTIGLQPQRSLITAPSITKIMSRELGVKVNKRTISSYLTKLVHDGLLSRTVEGTFFCTDIEKLLTEYKGMATRRAKRLYEASMQKAEEEQERKSAIIKPEPTVEPPLERATRVSDDFKHKLSCYHLEPAFAMRPMKQLNVGYKEPAEVDTNGMKEEIVAKFSAYVDELLKYVRREMVKEIIDTLGSGYGLVGGGKLNA